MNTTERVYNAIKRLTSLRGYAPSVAELRKAAKCSSNSIVAFHLDKLEKAGCIKRDANVARSLRIIAELPEAMKGVKSVLGDEGARAADFVLTNI